MSDICNGRVTDCCMSTLRCMCAVRVPAVFAVVLVACRLLWSLDCLVLSLGSLLVKIACSVI